MRLKVLGTVVLAVAVAGCPRAIPLPAPVDASVTGISFDTPVNGALVGFASDSSFPIEVTATAVSGITSMTLTAGNGAGQVELTRCSTGGQPAGWGTVSFPAMCADTFAIFDHLDAVSSGTLVLTATAIDGTGSPLTTTIHLTVSPLLCRIVVPGGDQTVSGVSQMVVQAIPVQSTTMLASVTVTADNGARLLNWPGDAVVDAGVNPTQWDLSVEVDTWGSIVGVGSHLLSAICTDMSENVVTASADVFITCTADQDCPTGRCCVDDNSCYLTVGENESCDCQHPCAASDVCVPPPCGGPPTCQPGCVLGADGGVRDTCETTFGWATVCVPVPASEATPENHGGVCIAGDNCDPVAQDCPDMQLIRAQPPTSPPCATQGPDCPNPTVPYNCVPFAGDVTLCVPAGNVPLQGSGCIQACGEIVGNCPLGALCVTPPDGGPGICDPICAQQGSTAGCPSGQTCVAPPESGVLSSGICE
jgi:hypothetical protein